MTFFIVFPLFTSETKILAPGTTGPGDYRVFYKNLLQQFKLCTQCPVRNILIHFSVHFFLKQHKVMDYNEN